MNRYLPRIALCLAVLALPSARADAGATYRAPQPGTVFTYEEEDGQTFERRVTEAQPESYAFDSTRGNRGEALGGMVVILTSQNQSAGWWARRSLRKLFPLAAGNAASFSYEGVTATAWSRSVEMSVMARETTTFEGKPIPAWPVRIVIEAAGFYHYDATCWFSEELGTCLRVTYRQRIQRDPNAKPEGTQVLKAVRRP